MIFFYLLDTNLQSRMDQQSILIVFNLSLKILKQHDQQFQNKVNFIHRSFCKFKSTDRQTFPFFNFQEAIALGLCSNLTLVHQKRMENLGFCVFGNKVGQFIAMTKATIQLLFFHEKMYCMYPTKRL